MKTEKPMTESNTHAAGPTGPNERPFRVQRSAFSPQTPIEARMQNAEMRREKGEAARHSGSQASSQFSILTSAFCILSPRRSSLRSLHPTPSLRPTSPPEVSQFSVQRSRSGFSLIELIVVVSIIGILAGVAMVSVKFATRKAREAALRDNLFTMRKAIDTFYGDKDRYPATLDELVPGYIRSVPKDPISMQPDWVLVMDDPMTVEGEMSADPDPEAIAQPGVVDVKSNAPGNTLDGTPYTDL